MGTQRKGGTDLQIWRTCSPSTLQSRGSGGDSDLGRRRAPSTSNRLGAVLLLYQRERWLPKPRATAPSRSNSELSSPNHALHRRSSSDEAPSTILHDCRVRESRCLTPP